MAKNLGVFILLSIAVVILSTSTYIVLEAGNIKYVTHYFADTFSLEENIPESRDTSIAFKEKDIHRDGKKDHRIIIRKKESPVSKIEKFINKLLEIPQDIPFYNQVEDSYYSSNITVYAGEQYTKSPTSLYSYYAPQIKEAKFAVYSPELGLIESKRMEIMHNFTETASAWFDNPLGADTYGILRNSQLQIKRRLVMQPGITDHYKFIYTIKHIDAPYFKDSTKFNFNVKRTLVTPSFVDLDNDGDLDLVLGEQYGKILYYENMGNSTDFDFVLKDSPSNSSDSNTFAGVNVHFYKGTGTTYKSNPTFADLDNDNDYDLILGSGQKYLGYYENIGSSSNPLWSEGSMFHFLNDTTPYDSAFADFDNDNDLDMVVANLYNLSYYENTGSVSNPSWSAGSYLSDFGMGMIFRSVDIVDFDGDNDYDIIVAGEVDITSETYKNVYLFENIGTQSVPSFKHTDNFTIEHGSTLLLSGVTKNPGLAVADLDGDGAEDLVYGNSNGTLTFYKRVNGNSSPITDIYFYEIPLLDFMDETYNGSIWYNHADDSFTVKWRYMAKPEATLVFFGDKQSAMHGIHPISWYYPYMWENDAKCTTSRYDSGEDLFWTDGQLNSLDSYDTVGASGEYYTCGPTTYNTTLTVAPALGFYIGNLSLGEEKNIEITYRHALGTGQRSYPDLSISNIRFSGLDNVTFTIVNDGGSSAVNPEFKLVDFYNNGVEFEFNVSINFTIRENVSTDYTVTFGLNKKHKVVIIADPDDKIPESDENNNLAEKTYNVNNVYLDIDLNDLNSLFEEYLESKLENYNIVTNENEADYKIYVGGTALNQETLANGWGVGKGYVKYYSKKGFYPYNGFVNILDSNVIIRGVNLDGVIAALRYVDWASLDDSKHYVGNDDKEGLLVFDFFRSSDNKPHLYKNSSQFQAIVRQALFGKYLEENKTIKTLEGVELRLRHLGSKNSLMLKEYLGLPDYPVVLARGLWSNVDAWQVFGQELADSGRDVWLAEITGGSNTECDTCADYTFQDLIEYHVPAVIGGVIEYTNKTQIQYVGFSNGCRSTLSSLETYSAIGKDPAGLYWNGTDFEYSIFGSNPVETFVGVGCPGAFNGNSPVKTIVESRGSETLNNLEESGKKHISLSELIITGLSGVDFDSQGSKISSNLWKNYSFWIMNDTDAQPGSGLTLDNFVAIRGFVTSDNHDMVVTKEDMDAIYSNVNSTNKTYFKIAGSHFAPTMSTSLADRGAAKDLITRKLNKKEFTEIQRCSNQLDPVDKPWWCIW